jgi:hypothetical protein
MIQYLGEVKIFVGVDYKLYCPLLSSVAILIGVLWMIVSLTIIPYRLGTHRMLAYCAYKESVHIVVERESGIYSYPPVVVRIRDALLVFNVLWLEGHLEPDHHFVF